MRDTIYLLINAILVNMDVKNVHPLLIVLHVELDIHLKIIVATLLF